MKILTKCDKCKSSFSVEDKFLGRKGKCPKCGEAFIVQAAQGAVEPPQSEKASPPPAKKTDAATANSDLFAIASDDTPRCPICQNALAPDAVLCVNCGYDLRVGTRVQYKKYTEEPKTKRKKKSSGIFTAQRLGLAGVLFAVLIGSIAAVWGSMALYRYLVDSWEQQEAFLRLDNVFSKEDVNAKKLAEDLPHIYAYMQQLPKRSPKYAQVRNVQFLECIPKIPKDFDLTPLLKFPPDLPEYQPILELLKKNTETSWQMQKSCDSSETARYYGADLLMASLPYLTWNEADKNSLRERTDIAEKERRFRKFAESSQIAAEKKLPGRYFFRIEATYSTVGRQKDKMLPIPDAKVRIAQTPKTVFEVISDNKTWKIAYFGRTWTGSIEQLCKIDLICPVMEHQGIFKTLPFYEQIAPADMHLHFNNGAFVIELENQADPEYYSEYQVRMMNLSGFTGFQYTLIKSAP